jgi:hypothetical protein
MEPASAPLPRFGNDGFHRERHGLAAVLALDQRLTESGDLLLLFFKQPHGGAVLPRRRQTIAAVARVCRRWHARRLEQPKFLQILT